MRDPVLILAIARRGWVAGHRRYRLRCLGRKLRKCGVTIVFVALAIAVSVAVCGSPEDRNHTTDAVCGVEGADCGEAHSLREADDLCHGANVAPSAARLPTMIDGAFQGAT